MKNDQPPRSHLAASAAHGRRCHRCGERYTGEDISDGMHRSPTGCIMALKAKKLALLDVITNMVRDGLAQIQEDKDKENDR